jgi:GNAT superfamily N-acetyltransferase
MEQNENGLRACGEDDVATIARIINAAAHVYRGVIPAECWHEPYMPLAGLQMEIAAGVHFTAAVRDGALIGVMGVQAVRDVRLIRHAYVLPEWQGHGIGSQLIASVRGTGDRRVLIGTWRAAHWAIGFYRRHGFDPVPDAEIAPLLRTYWTVPERQIHASIVLSSAAVQASRRAASGHP